MDMFSAWSWGWGGLGGGGGGVGVGVGGPPVNNGHPPHKGPATRSFDIFVIAILNRILNKKSS